MADYPAVFLLSKLSRLKISDPMKLQILFSTNVYIKYVNITANKIGNMNATTPADGSWIRLWIIF